jgi:biotin synthase
MIRDNGFVILGQENAFNDGTFDEVFNAPRGGHAHAAVTTPCGSSAGSACGDGCGGCTALNPEAKAASSVEPVDSHDPAIRHRGAGTEVPANA